MWWFSIIGLIIEIIKLLMSLRRENDCKALEFEYEQLKGQYKETRDRAILERFRDRLKERYAAAAK